MLTLVYTQIILSLSLSESQVAVFTTIEDNDTCKDPSKTAQEAVLMYTKYMKNDEFTKLFKYMEGRFDDMDRRFDETASKKQVEHLIDTIDGFVARLDSVK